MKRILIILTICLMLFSLTACNMEKSVANKEAKAVAAQQDQYAKGQPVPAFDWSLERDLVIKLYQMRNVKVATHTVWRSDYGMIEGDCPSIGYGIPYDTSLTNPLVATDVSDTGSIHTYQGGALASIEQAEPNGIYASKNTTATWIMSVDKETGQIMPLYIEGKVTVYPYPVKVDYTANRVYRAGKPSTTIAIN